MSNSSSASAQLTSPLATMAGGVSRSLSTRRSARLAVGPAGHVSAVCRLRKETRTGLEIRPVRDAPLAVLVAVLLPVLFSTALPRPLARPRVQTEPREDPKRRALIGQRVRVQPRGTGRVGIEERSLDRGIPRVLAVVVFLAAPLLVVLVVLALLLDLALPVACPVPKPDAVAPCPRRTCAARRGTRALLGPGEGLAVLGTLWSGQRELGGGEGERGRPRLPVRLEQCRDLRVFLSDLGEVRGC